MAGLVKLFLRGLSKSQLPGAERNSGEPPREKAPLIKAVCILFLCFLEGLGVA